MRALSNDTDAITKSMKGAGNVNFITGVAASSLCCCLPIAFSKTEEAFEMKLERTKKDL